MPESAVPDELFDADDHTPADRSDWIVQDGGLIHAPVAGDFVSESLQAPLRVPDEAPASTRRKAPGMNSYTTVGMPGRPRAVIVDIDGTVAKHVLSDGTLLRGHHDYRLVVWDLPNLPVIDTVNALREAGHEIIFCSGRPERDDRGYSVRTATRSWLCRHLGEWAEDAMLLMRGQGDMRPDHAVKHELFNAHICGAYDVLLALDDRDRVVALWRSLGIVCLQVDKGNF
ncbi:phosphatase domain-containing protein [Streptomyces microflavus]|uniref:phosphatase domain-containing protein n=1 Tax=Streptomyces microflavus TaxID=1919 RepID=UPI00381AB4A6